MPSSEKSWSRRAKRFWDSRQKRSRPGQLTGYLLDGSPASIGQHRFEGEWAQAKAWIKREVLLRDRCLDLGCGTGEWLRALAAEFKHAEGWDYAPAMIAASRRNLREAGVRNVTLNCGQLTQRRGKSAFDFIFVGGVLMYTPDKDLGPLLKSLKRLLKPGGRLLLRESTFPGGSWLREGEPLKDGLLAKGDLPALDYVAIYRSRETLRARLESAGFKLEAAKPNLHYKLSVRTLDWLWSWDRSLSGRLRQDAAAAERAAAWIYRLRYLLIYPELILRIYLRYKPWKLENHWFLCSGAQRSSSTWKER